MSNLKPRLDERSLPTDRLGRRVEVLGNVGALADDPDALEKTEIRAPRPVGEAWTERFIWLLHSR